MESITNVVLFSFSLATGKKVQQSKQSLTGNFYILKIWENNMNLNIVSNFAHSCIIYFKNVNLNSDFTKDFFLKSTQVKQTAWQTKP